MRNILKKNINKIIKPTIVITTKTNPLTANTKNLPEKVRAPISSLYFILNAVVIAPSHEANKKTDELSRVGVLHQLFVPILYCIAVSVVVKVMVPCYFLKGNPFANCYNQRKDKTGKNDNNSL